MLLCVHARPTLQESRYHVFQFFHGGHILPSPSSRLFQLGNLQGFILRYQLTNVDEASGRPAAKLLALEAERDLDDPRDVAGRSLDTDGVRGDQLAPHEHRAEHDLSTDMNANER